MKNLIVILSLLILLCSGCEEIISVADISEETVQLKYPLNGSLIKNDEVLFNWEKIAYADAYEVQIVSPNFEELNQLILDTIVLDSMPVLFSKKLDDGFYEWKVKAMNSASSTAYESAGFEVKDSVQFSDGEIVVVAPEDAYVTTKTIVDLQWEILEEAQLYRIVIEEATTGDLFLEETTINPFLKVNFELGTYIWKVRGEKDEQYTVYTAQTISIEE